MRMRLYKIVNQYTNMLYFLSEQAVNITGSINEDFVAALLTKALIVQHTNFAME